MEVYDQVSFGTLLFYRWPPQVPWAEAGEMLQPFLHEDLSVERFGIWHGNQRGPVTDQWSPEVRTACAIIYLHSLDPAQAETLKQIFARGVVKCRFRGQDPSSAVTWLPDSKPIRITTTTAEKIPDLQDLVDQGHFDVIHGLNACIEAMDGWIKPKDRSSRRRYNTDVTNMKPALNAVQQAQSPTASTALSRLVLPQTSVSTYLAREASGLQMPSFASVVADASALKLFDPLRPGMQGPSMHSTDALRLLNKQLTNKALESVRHGLA